MTEKSYDRQTGKGAFGTILSLAVLAAFALAIWNVAPLYMTDYELGDRMLEICRMHRGSHPDEDIRDRLWTLIKEERLEEFLGRDSVKIQTRDASRKLTVEYERTVKVLPGWVKTFKFSHEVDQPFF